MTICSNTSHLRRGPSTSHLRGAKLQYCSISIVHSNHTSATRLTMEELRVELKNNSQDHLLAFWDTLSPDDQKQLYGDLRSIDYPEVMRYFKACTETADRPTEKVDDHLQPIPAAVLGSVTRTDAETLAAYQEEGETSCFAALVVVLNFVARGIMLTLLCL